MSGWGGKRTPPKSCAIVMNVGLERACQAIKSSPLHSQTTTVRAGNGQMI